jgi:hypothetical protein
MNNELTAKQQTSEAIRQAETILITTGQRPSVDQLAATLALAAILKKFGKKVSAIISDPLPATAQWLETSAMDTKLSGLRDFILKVNTSKVEVDSLRYEPEGDHLNIYITPFAGGFAPNDVTFEYGDYHYDLAIVLGVAQKGRIDRVYADNLSLFGQIPLVNIDYHRSNENYAAINLVDPQASSICEMLVATSESLQTGMIDAEIATIMLGGIMAATDRFTAAHTTSKSLTVAAQMMAAGADQPAVVRGMFGPNVQSDAPRERNENRSTPARNDHPSDRTDNRNKRDVAGPFPARTQRPVQDGAVIETMQLPRDEQLNEVAIPNELVIEPDHMEMMQQEDIEHEAVSEELPKGAPSDHVPMADFSAAAEILRAREVEKPAEA